MINSVLRAVFGSGDAPMVTLAGKRLGRRGVDATEQASVAGLPPTPANFAALFASLGQRR